MNAEADTHASNLLRQPIIRINDDQTLADYCNVWDAARLLAIDTEFMRVDTYFPIASLIQINDGKANYLIDPLLINSWQPLSDIMLAPHVIKAFHACSEDLDVFNTLLGVLPVSLFDTQIAAALIGIGASVGYANLVNECLGVDLPKGETRSNWLARPLTDAQILYAALDVDYLYELAHLLEEKLTESSRETWLYEESQAVIDNYISNADPASGFYKSNNTWRLDSADLAIAKRLFEWRENTAKMRNIPRTRIVKDAQIFELLNRKPDALAQLKLLGFYDGAIRKFGKDILAILHLPVDPAAEQNAQLKPSQVPLTKPQRERAKQLKSVVNALAEKNNIATEYLARKADYHQIVRETPNDMDDLEAIKFFAKGWRKTFFETSSAQ